MSSTEVHFLSKPLCHGLQDLDANEIRFPNETAVSHGSNVVFYLPAVNDASG